MDDLEQPYDCFIDDNVNSQFSAMFFSELDRVFDFFKNRRLLE